MYSQNNEEQLIISHLAMECQDVPPRLLDIGAYDGITFSNSAKLIELAWDAVLVEPAPGPFSKLLDRYGRHTNVQLVNAAVALDRRIVDFWDSSGDGVSTTEAENLAKWSAHAEFRRMFVQTLPLSELLGVFPGPYTIVSIDTEGTSSQLFGMIPFENLGTRVIVVEHDGHITEIVARGKNLGFRVADVNGENVILVK